jgi:hypothetical protein
MTKQYRIMRAGAGFRGYYVLVTHGLADTERIHGGKVWLTQAEARSAAKAHAEKANVKPIILV